MTQKILFKVYQKFIGMSSLFTLLSLQIEKTLRSSVLRYSLIKTPRKIHQGFMTLSLRWSS